MNNQHLKHSKIKNSLLCLIPLFYTVQAYKKRDLFLMQNQSYRNITMSSSHYQIRGKLHATSTHGKDTPGNYRMLHPHAYNSGC